MKNASPALLALFASRQPFQQFDLYTFTLSSGFVMRYANIKFDVLFGGNTWLCSRSAGGIVIDEDQDQGPRASWKTGFQVGTWEVTVMPRSSDVIGALPWVAAVRAGIMQEAMCRVDRAYINAWPDVPGLTIVPIGTVNVFLGRVAEIDFGRSSIQINMNDPRELIDIDMPRNVYSRQCRFALFSSQCTLNPAAFADAAHVSAAPTTQAIQIAGGPARAASYYSLGNVVFTTGNNAGLRMMVRSSDAAGNLSLIAPLPFPFSIGDQLTIYPGCDKQESTCVGKFNNVANFGGFPFIPVPETAV